MLNFIRAAHVKYKSVPRLALDITDASGNSLVIIGTATLSVRLERENARSVFCVLISPSLADKEVLVGWRTMHDWGLLPSSYPYPPKHYPQV